MISFRCLLTLACAMLLPSLVLAQAYPVKPVRMIIPFPPGGPTDLMGRMAADRLSRAWGVQVVADNRGGAGGNIGFEQCAKSPPYGYTVCIAVQGPGPVGNRPVEKWDRVAKAADVKVD